MGKTSKPLRILDTGCYWPEIDALETQGHFVTRAKEMPSYDIILGPACWLMDEIHRPYLYLAIEAARAKKYPKEKK